MPTLVDRILVKFGILPKSAVAQSEVIANRKPEVSIEDLNAVPRYPPFMEGLPVYPPSTLLATQKELVDGVRQIIANETLLNEHYTPAMMRLAGLVQMLPASQSHHHRGAGGMLRHSLEVGLWALQQTEGKLIRGVIAPQQRRVIEPRWKLTVFLAGICHDLGKVITDISVTDRANELKWHPCRHGLYDWAVEHKINKYFLHWNEGRGKKHVHVSGTLLPLVVSQETMDWIIDGSTEAWVWLNESLNNNPSETNQVYNLVVKADQFSVERDLKSMGVAMAGYEIGVPVERYLIDVMKRLVREGIWRINEPSARVWNLDGMTYLVWPMAGEEIARRIKDEDIPGLPKTADGILDMMVEREIAFMRDDEDESDPYYYISPDVITEKIPNMRMKAIRLRDQALISSVPIASIPGKVYSSKTDGTTECADAQGESPQNSQNDSDAPVERVETASTQETPSQGDSSTSVERLSKIGSTKVVEKETPTPKVVEEETPAPPLAQEPSPPPSEPLTQDSLTLESLDGAMGELFRVLIGEFKSGKKVFDNFGARQTDGSIYLKWPETFSGYGFTGKQILDGLTELGWLIPASDVAKVGKFEFSDGIFHSIKLSPAVGHLFSAFSSQSSAPAKLKGKSGEIGNPLDAGQTARAAEKSREQATKKKASTPQVAAVEHLNSSRAERRLLIILHQQSMSRD